MKQLSKSFNTPSSPNSPHFPNYLQRTQASNTKSSKSLPKSKGSKGRSFIYKQENILGPVDINGRKKLLAKNRSNGSLLSLMERTDPYIIKDPRRSPPRKENKNSYRVYMPEYNCETPKFQGLRTYYKDFLNLDPICNKIMGDKGKIEEKPIIIQRKADPREKENNVSCLPQGQKEKVIGKKIVKRSENQQDFNNLTLKNLIQGKFFQEPPAKDEEVVWKKPLKKQHSKIFQGNNIFEHEEKSFINNENSPLNSSVSISRKKRVLNILPDGPEKTFRKNPIIYPNQRRIIHGDADFWHDFKTKDGYLVTRNESKVNNLNYRECVNWMRHEKESFDRYLRNESLENSQGSIYKEREHRRKQFPQSPIFRTNIQLG